jgi:hypothetical protein
MPAVARYAVPRDLQNRRLASGLVLSLVLHALLLSLQFGIPGIRAGLPAPLHVTLVLLRLPLPCQQLLLLFLGLARQRPLLLLGQFGGLAALLVLPRQCRRFVAAHALVLCEGGIDRWISSCTAVAARLCCHQVRRGLLRLLRLGHWHGEQGVRIRLLRNYAFGHPLWRFYGLDRFDPARGTAAVARRRGLYRFGRGNWPGRRDRIDQAHAVGGPGLGHRRKRHRWRGKWRGFGVLRDRLRFYGRGRVRYW